MRIAHLSAWYPPHTLGGTEIYVESLCATLRQLGHDLAVAAPLVSIPQPARETRAGIPTLRYPTPARPTKAEARGVVSARGSEHLIAWVRQWKPDVVHVHSLSTGLHVPELRDIAATGARVVLTLHLPTLTYVCQRGTLAIWGERACDGRRLRRRCAACATEARGLPLPLAWMTAATPMMVARAARHWPTPVATAIAMPALIDDLADQQRELFEVIDAAVPLNTISQAILAKNGAPPEKVVLNRLGISHAPRRKPLPDVAPTKSPVTIGYFGRLNTHKGVDDLVAAIDALPRELAARFVFHGIAADAVGRALLDGLRALANRRAGIEVKPELAPHEVPSALANIDVLCAPSRWFENGPTIALEAMAAGTPVIGTMLGGFCDFVEDGVSGRLLPPGDVRALTRALLDVASDPANTIDRWRSRLPAPRTMHDVARDYDGLYRRIVVAQASPVAG